jgi:hypothetical protein
LSRQISAKADALFHIQWFNASIFPEARFQRKCRAIDLVTNFFARPMACSSERPDARPAVIAAE